jgi:drug/metabolite transporter (DMT)-like permease
MMTTTISTRTRAYACLALAMVTVGSTVVASRTIAGSLPPFTATALRLGLAFAVFVWLMRRAGLAWPRPSRRDAVLLVLQALAGSVGYTVLLIAGLQRATAADAGVIAGTLPAVSGLVAIVLLGERPSLALCAVLLLATGGVVALHAGAGASPEGAHSLMGNALVLAAVVCEAVFILLNRKLAQPLQPLVLSTLMTGLGFALSLVPALMEHPLRYVPGASVWLALVYYALVPTVGGYLLWYAGSARVAASEAAVFTALVPVSALVLAAWLLGEQITPRHMAGAACVLLAVALAARTSPKESTQHEPA